MARPNRARHFSDGAASPRACPERQYGVADRINARIAGLKGVHSPNVGGANFSFTLDTFSCGAISRRVAPRPFRRVLRPRSPAPHFRRKQIPDFIDPAQHACEFGLYARQPLAQFEQFVVFLFHGWHALAVPFVVHLREFPPGVGQSEPKCPILPPRLPGQFAARLCLLSIHVGGVPCRGLAFLRTRYSARGAFERAQIGQAAESLRPSHEFHGLGAALARQRRWRGIVGNHNDPQFFLFLERGSRRLPSQQKCAHGKGRASWRSE